ncbi:hypothetical protein EVAR_27478_1 [Eumeta japonica]|uniref:Mariner Mos1 transposase n=1 Tax=Eumeta variegata TaxID=151549 RepID=A0A4C1XCH1_EUMVA|nr:hypothetical protein EVAR_27478_1 [Eumeta japonica]
MGMHVCMSHVSPVYLSVEGRRKAAVGRASTSGPAAAALVLNACRHRHELNTITSTQTFGYEKGVLAMDLTNLTVARKADRVSWYNAMLSRFKEGASNLVLDIVAGDKIWTYCYDPKTKQQSTACIDDWLVSGIQNVKAENARSSNGPARVARAQRSEVAVSGGERIIRHRVIIGVRWIIHAR